MNKFKFKISKLLLLSVLYCLSFNSCKPQTIGLSELMNAAKCDTVECFNKYFLKYNLILDTVGTKYFQGKNSTAYFFSLHSSTSESYKSWLMFSSFNSGTMQGTVISITVSDSTYFMSMLANLKEKKFVGNPGPAFPISQSKGENVLFGTENMEYHSPGFSDYLIRSAVMKSTNKNDESETRYFLMVMRADIDK